MRKLHLTDSYTPSRPFCGRDYGANLVHVSILAQFDRDPHCAAAVCKPCRQEYNRRNHAQQIQQTTI